MFNNKLVAVLNKSVEPGKAMNALAHMTISLGAQIGVEELQLVDYFDADNNKHPQISKMPFMILRANSNKIRNCKEQALANDIQCVDFTETMTVGTWEEQIERTKATATEDLVYYGIVMFGDWEQVSNMTKKFSLWH